tara:strand:- start:514 stop:816 length:303 start_codon:yes stop_codon:yes gene_type:complete
VISGTSLSASSTNSKEFSFGCWNGLDKISGRWTDTTNTILLFGNKFFVIDADLEKAHFGLASSKGTFEFLITSGGSYNERIGKGPWKTFPEVECILNFYD